MSDILRESEGFLVLQALRDPRAHKDPKDTTDREAKEALRDLGVPQVLQDPLVHLAPPETEYM